MTCTKEEIERKRLAALQKKQAKVVNDNTNLTTAKPTVAPNYAFKSLSPGPLKVNNTHKSFHPYAKTEKSAERDTNVPITKVVSGTTYLISENRFEVNPSEFCMPLINIFKSLPSKCYNQDTNLWNFSIDDYQDLMSKVAPLAPHVILGPLPSYVLKVLKQEIVDPNGVDLTPIESSLREKLLTFQEEGVRFGISRRGRCMIADDMGLGKTFQALAVASYYRHDWPLLIVTTSSMRETWQKKIYELLNSVPIVSVVTLSTKKDISLVADRQVWVLMSWIFGATNLVLNSSNAAVTASYMTIVLFETEVVIVSYKIASIYKDALKTKKFGVVIIDESHYLKSYKAQCTAALGGIARQASRVVLLSGTPALSRPSELYTQLSLIDPKLFTSYMDYGKRYCDGKQTNFGWDMSGQSNLRELQVILRRFLIRRTKEQVLNLGEKTRESVMLDESLLEFKKDQQSGLSDMALAYHNTQSKDKHAALLTFFSETAQVKIKAVCKYIKENVVCGEDKFIVFAHHRCMFMAVCDTLDCAGVAYVHIAGGTPSCIRSELAERFQFGGGCRGAVLSVTAAGVGLTLTAAALVVFAELHWNPGILIQAEARAHRLGRSGGLRVRYLLARGTADDLIWPMLQEKLDVLNKVGLSQDTFEDAALKHQNSNGKITNFLSPTSVPRNKNDYIPGTNIRKSTDGRNSPSISNLNSLGESSWNVHNDLEDLESFFLDDEDMVESFKTVDVQSSFLADDEGDEILANFEL